MDVDAAADDSYFNDVNGARAKRVKEYFGEPRNFHELCVFTTILDCFDRFLLHPLFGDALARQDLGEKNSKVDMLLDADKSLVGKCTSGLCELLNDWALASGLKRP